MARNLRCSWCGDTAVDDVTVDDHSYGQPWQEEVVEDIPTLCKRCNEKAKGY